MRSRLVDLALILIAGIVSYSHVSTVWFCGYDDFADIHRAVFEDTPNPTRIFTTTHFGTSKYRPLQRGLTWLCWRLGNGSPLPYRVRNLFFHLMAALLVYGIALSLTGDRTGAVAAGLLFCLHPFANQSVVAAIWTNSTAYATLLASLFLFIRGVQSGTRGLVAGSLVLALIGMFLYESVIVVFGIMFGYLIVRRVQNQKIDRGVLVAWAGGSAAVFLIFAVIRHMVVTAATARAPLSDVVHNVLVYAVSLLLPIDPVLANALFGSALPPNIHPGGKTLILAGAGALAVLVLGIRLRRTLAISEGLRRLNVPVAVFLIASIGMALAPLVLFTPHASETYLYLPSALVSILIVLVLRAFLSNRVVWLLAISLLVCSFAAGTWVRNQRVARCGEIAAKVISEMPLARWAEGQPYLRMAHKPGEPMQPRYGIYGYDGLSTIDPSEPGVRSAEMAIQVETGNDKVRVDVVPASEMSATCPVPETCFLVSREGDVVALHN